MQMDDNRVHARVSGANTRHMLNLYRQAIPCVLLMDGNDFSRSNSQYWRLHGICDVNTLMRTQFGKNRVDSQPNAEDSGPCAGQLKLIVLTVDFDRSGISITGVSSSSKRRGCRA